MTYNTITIVQGGQYGSEAKGAIAGYLCRTRAYDYAVRTGATNAGHTVYVKGLPVKMQQLPVGFVSPNTKLVLGAGSIIDPEILAREVALINSLHPGTDVCDRLIIDRRAYLHRREHADRSASSGRHHLMGATGKGCSEALVDRVMLRGKEDWTFGKSEFAKDYDVCDTEMILNTSWDEGATIMLEGTQGQLLDLCLGPYPYTTHKQTGPAQWMLEAGLSPALPTEIVMVVRTFPIRVAGNSGPLPQEISWPILAREINGIRIVNGQTPLVKEESIREFEEAIRWQANAMFVPKGSDGLDQHAWSEADRLRNRNTLSELNTYAWKSLTPEIQADLSRLFELTTVTKKLRRIARLDLATLRASARQVRPHWVALTFMNYLFPERWYNPPTDLSPDEREFVRQVEEACQAPVRLISYGPEDSHLLRWNSTP